MRHDSPRIPAKAEFAVLQNVADYLSDDVGKAWRAGSKMKGLTRKQLAVYEFVRERIADGIPPTRADICAKFGYRSNNSAELMIKAIIKKGYLVHVPGISRGLRLP